MKNIQKPFKHCRSSNSFFVCLHTFQSMSTGQSSTRIYFLGLFLGQRPSRQIILIHKYCLYKKYKNMVDIVPLGNFYSTKHVFSCVPSDGGAGRMHGNTDYICLILLYCVFSNVSSNCLPQRMQNYTGGVCWTFLTMGFLMSPQRT